MNYVIEFSNDFVRDLVMRYYHIKRKQLNSDLTYTVVFKLQVEEKIVFCELTPKFTHNLLKQILEVKKAKNCHRVWQSRGNIYVKKRRDSEPARIYTPSDLRALN